jgi:hypothetical protein
MLRNVRGECTGNYITAFTLRKKGDKHTNLVRLAHTPRTTRTTRSSQLPEDGLDDETQLRFGSMRYESWGVGDT